MSRSWTFDSLGAAASTRPVNFTNIVSRQAHELLELSTPVVELWNKIILLPLIGTLDSKRGQMVMENLLNQIVKCRADIAIVDISGVPTVDTLVAQHLIKTVSATRLMGADCIISGIRPQIAQTIVHLGVQLAVVSKATTADACALAKPWDTSWQRRMSPRCHEA
jgi:rsbT co-antagonist protein RsbR